MKIDTDTELVLKIVCVLSSPACSFPCFSVKTHHNLCVTTFTLMSLPLSKISGCRSCESNLESSLLVSFSYKKDTDRCCGNRMSGFLSFHPTHFTTILSRIFHCWLTLSQSDRHTTKCAWQELHSITWSCRTYCPSVRLHVYLICLFEIFENCP